MQKLSKDDKDKIIEKLKEKKANPVCPMCGNRKFAIADSYFNNTLQDDLANLKLGGPSIPTIPTICTNCGFIAQHSLGILGLLENKGEDDEN